MVLYKLAQLKGGYTKKSWTVLFVSNQVTDPSYFHELWADPNL